MKHLLSGRWALVAFALLLSPMYYSQTLSPVVVPTQGAVSEGQGYTLSWTLGETFTKTQSAGGAILTQGFQQPELDLVTGSITGPVCPTGTLEISYIAIGFFGPANTFTAQLSDASGSFGSPVVIGSVQSAVSGTIEVDFPEGIAAGNNYRIRVVASTAGFVGKASNAFEIESPQIWFADADGDGYGNPGAAIASCDQPAGYVTNNDDCNDAHAGVYPGATEVCNDLDDDCDGNIDEGVGISWFIDADNDGYGNALITLIACSQPAGYVSIGSDCNDSNASIYPGATEVCNNIDDDCDGQIDEGAGNAPPMPAWISGPTTVCAYQQGLVYCCPPIAGAQYIWEVPSGVTIISGQNTPCITVNWGNKKGKLSVRYRTSCGNGPKRTINVNLGPCAPANPGMELYTGDAEQVELRTYPNPFTDMLNIEFELESDTQAQLEILDLAGRQVALLHAGELPGGTPLRFQYTPENVSAGMLICRLVTDSGIYYSAVVLAGR